MTEIVCPHCGNVGRTDQAVPAGAKLACKRCHQRFSFGPALPVPVPAIAARPIPEPETVACPFCAETIRRAARKCKHCGELLDPTLRPVASAPAPPPVVVQQVNQAASDSEPDLADLAMAAALSRDEPAGCGGCLFWIVILAGLLWWLSRQSGPDSPGKPVSMRIAPTPSAL